MNVLFLNTTTIAQIYRLSKCASTGACDKPQIRVDIVDHDIWLVENHTHLSVIKQ